MPIVTLTPDQLRARHTLKWMRHTPDVLPMWVAEMDVATAPVVIEAVREAAEREVFGYAAADSRLPEATAAWCAERYAWQIDPSLVYPLPDVLCGIRLAIDCFTVQGSPIVLPVPAYAPFFSALDVTGRRGIFVRMISHREADGRAGYRFDLDAIEDAFIAGAGGLILCNPYNPLGAVFPQSTSPRCVPWPSGTASGSSRMRSTQPSCTTESTCPRRPSTRSPPP